MVVFFLFLIKFECFWKILMFLKVSSVAKAGFIDWLQIKTNYF